MDRKGRCVIALVGVATMFVSGCAVEVPKSALPAFGLTAPAELTNAIKPELDKPVDTSS